MTIQHKDIPNANLHEPKGASTAAVNTVYASNGSGSGTWKKVDTSTFRGLTGDGGIAGKRLLTDGSNGFTLSTDMAYGSMVINNNTNGFALTAAVDSTLATNSDYVLFTGTGAPWASENLFGISFNTNRLIAPVAGMYEVELWSSISGFPTNTAKVSVKHRVNGGTFSSRHPVAKSNSAGDAGQLTGFGLVTLAANDYIQLYVASSATGNLTFSDVNVTLKLVRAL